MGGRMKLPFVLAGVEVVPVPYFLCMHSCWMWMGFFSLGFSLWVVNGHCQPYGILVSIESINEEDFGGVSGRGLPEGINWAEKTCPEYALHHDMCRDPRLYKKGKMKDGLSTSVQTSSWPIQIWASSLVSLLPSCLFCDGLDTLKMVLENEIFLP